MNLVNEFMITQFNDENKPSLNQILYFIFNNMMILKYNLYTLNKLFYFINHLLTLFK
jgi:hypothetical protein